MKRILFFLALLPLSAFADDLRVVASTSQCVGVFVSDSSSSTGAGLTGLAYNTASLTCYYYLPATAGTATTCGLASSTLGTYTSGAFKEISSSNMPGWYEFCPPNAALASGAEAVFQLKGATNMAPTNLRIVLLNAAPTVDGSGYVTAGDLGTTAIRKIPQSR